MAQDIGYTRETLEAAESALSLLSARFEEREARAQERRNMLVAFLGLILAVSQLIANEEAQSFLGWAATLFGWTPGPYTLAQLFAARLVLAVIAGLAGVVIVWGIGKLARAGKQTTRS
ncbi:MAG: hypothetical protein ACE5LU_03345 [Anaerolineae bacterium]